MEHDAPTDEQIVTRVLAGDSALFELIMRRHNQRLFRAARAILRNEAEAEDAVQQAYISAFEHLDQFQGDAQLATWLTRIAIRAALARLRGIKRRGETELELQPQEEAMSAHRPSAETPEQQVATRELTRIVENAVDELPEIYRLVFVMREVQQLSTAEAAACLEVSEDVIKIRLHRAKAMLRDAMSSQVDAAAAEAFAFLGARCDRIVAAVLSRILRTR
ncbi:MAG TPA: RNA polymerase sigma factor [Polyangia bacterium]